MQKQFKDRFSLGIIDKDKHVLNYLNEFNEVCRSSSLILYKHKTRHHYVIQIYPTIERFIWLSFQDYLNEDNESY